MDNFSRIPPARQPAVMRALDEAFCIDDIEDVEEMRVVEGSSVPSFRIVDRGEVFLLRLLRETEASGDLSRQLACMKIARLAGVSPRVEYADVEDRIFITEFIEAKPLPESKAGLLADALGKLHALPTFPDGGNYFDTVDGFIARFREARGEGTLVSERACEELFQGYSEIAKVYPRDHDWVPSHNNLKPENIVYDGERVWLTDWQAAHRNDRYVDLAMAANLWVSDEEAFLGDYFGEPAGEYRQARYFLMRQAVHVASAISLMLGCPDEGELQRAWGHWSEALRNMRSPRFQSSLGWVAADPKPVPSPRIEFYPYCPGDRSVEYQALAPVLAALQDSSKRLRLVDGSIPVFMQPILSPLQTTVGAAPISS